MAEVKSTQYKVFKPFEHNGKPLRPGDSINLTDENAVYLLRKRVIRKIGEQEEQATTPLGEVEDNKEHEA